MIGLPVGNIPLGEDPPARSTVERSVSLPVNQQHLGGYGDVRNFTPQLRPNASPDTGFVKFKLSRIKLLINSCFLFRNSQSK